jgi:hypothetical protein
MRPAAAVSSGAGAAWLAVLHAQELVQPANLREPDTQPRPSLPLHPAGNSPHVLNRSPTTLSRAGSSSTGLLGRGALAASHARMGGGGGGMDVPPAGCGPDAYKLFVGNIPKMFTEGDLLPVSFDVLSCAC